MRIYLASLMLPIYPSSQHFYVSPGTLFSTHSLFSVDIVPPCVGLWATFLLISEFSVFLLSSYLTLDGAPWWIILFVKREVGIGQIARREHVSLASLG